MTGLDAMIRSLIREEIRRLIRPDAIAANAEDGNPLEDLELRERAADVASRFKRARGS